MFRFLPILFVALFITACNTSETQNTLPETAPASASQEKQGPENRNPDKSVWFSTEATSKLEKELGLTALTEKAQAINTQLETSSAVKHHTCKAWYGPGALAFYGESNQIVKIRVDWAVETAHSKIEYYLEDGKVFLMDLINADYGNYPEANNAWMGTEPKPEPVKMVEGRYFFENGRIKKIIFRDWMVDATKPDFAQSQLTQEQIEGLNTSIGKDLEHLKEYNDEKIDCEGLAALGYYP
jgi:hypothetical protein